MSQMLASDLNNPEFVGASNPDARLSVVFFSKPLKNNFRTEQEGRPIFDDCDMVRIYVPGDDKNIVETFVRDDHKRRFPLQWAHYQNKMQGDQRLAGKTPINQWPRITPAQAEELRALKFLSVEDVANASDSNIQQIGMLAGMSPYAFREAAQRYLKLASDESAAAKGDERLKAMEAENQAMKEQMQKMQAHFEMLANQTQSAPEEVKSEEAPRRGRPPKES